MKNRRTRAALSLAGVLIGAAAAMGCGGGGSMTADEVGESPVAVSASGDTPAPVPVTAADELVGSWLLEDLCGRGVVDGVRSTLEFDADGRLSGTGGCNRFSGSYDLDDGRLEIGPVAATKMMCPEAVMGQEDAFLTVLGAVERVEMDDSVLVIRVAGEAEPLRLTRINDEIEL